MDDEGLIDPSEGQYEVKRRKLREDERTMGNNPLSEYFKPAVNKDLPRYVTVPISGNTLLNPCFQSNQFTSGQTVTIDLHKMHLPRKQPPPPPPPLN